MTAASTSTATTLRVDLDRTWWSFAGPHGGRLAALALAAAAPLTSEMEPRSLSAQYLRPAPEGQVQVDAELLRAGRSTAMSAVRLAGSDGRTALVATVTAGSTAASGHAYDGVPMPDVAGPGDCAEQSPPVDFVPFSQHLEFRPVGEGQAFAGGEVPELMAWLRLRSGGPVDAEALTVLVDALPPALYAVAAVPAAVPTVELSVTYAPQPEPYDGWVLARIRTRTAAGGWCVDDSDVWDVEGRLLAQARQTRLVLGPLS